MSKLGGVLEIVRTLVKNPSSIARVLPEGYQRMKLVHQTYGLEDGLPTIDILDLCPDFCVTVAPYTYLQGTSTVVDIALLNALAAQRKHCNYLEIGTLRGESVANVARFADRCVSISLSPEQMKQRGFPTEFTRMHKLFSGGLSNVEHIGADSHRFDYASLNDKFDLIFIDGDHSYHSIAIDTRNAFKMLRDDESVIVWHDYGTTTETVRWDSLAGILEGCPSENRKHLYHVSNTLCAIFTRSEFETHTTRYPETPNKQFEVEISARRL